MEINYSEQFIIHEYFLKCKLLLNEEIDMIVGLAAFLREGLLYR